MEKGSGDHKGVAGAKAPRTVRTVKAFLGQEHEAELSFKPGALIARVWLACWLHDSKFFHSHWLAGTFEGRVGLVPEFFVEYLPPA